MYWILHVLELFHQVTMVTSADLIAEREWLSQSEILRTVSWKLKLSLRCFWEFAVQGLTILFFFFFSWNSQAAPSVFPQIVCYKYYCLGSAAVS